MIQFLGTVIFVIIATGLALHAGLELPWYVAWIGTLPGDILIKKGNLTLYAPVATSVLISVALSFLSSLFSGKEK